MRFRKFPTIIVLLTAGALALGGCAPLSPDAESPAPLSTGGTSAGEDTSSAAETSYRAYVDALNARRAGDDGADPARFLRGDALEEYESGEDLIRGMGVRVIGETHVAAFKVNEVERQSGDTLVRAESCLDVSRTRLVDQQGNELTPEDRSPLIPLTVVMRSTDGGLRVSASEAGGKACESLS